MFKMILAVLVVISTSITLHGQQGVVGDEYRLALDDLYARGSMQEFDLRKKVSIDRIFFRDSWLRGHVFYDEERRTTNEYNLKFDLWNKDVIVNILGDSYLVPKEGMKGFFLEEVRDDGDILHRFVVEDYRKSKRSKAKSIIFELAVEGRYTLLIRHKPELLKSNRVEALDMGDQNDRVLHKKYFFLRDTNGRIHKIPKRRKAAIKFFQRFRESTEYLENNDVNFKDRKSLSQMISYMNK